MRKRERGVTLIEILISLAIVLVGMAGMFRVLASSVQGSSSASKLSQAQYRAETILESVRSAPPVGLACLVATPPAQWATCEATCKTALGGLAAHDTACLFTTASMKKLNAPDTASKTPKNAENGLSGDRNQQMYYLAASGGGEGARDDSFVKVAGANLRVYDVQVSIYWNDDNSEGLKTGSHTLVLRTGVFR